MNWARLNEAGDTVVEVTDLDPGGRFHPSIVWSIVPDGTVQNAKWVDDNWVNPVAPDPDPEPDPVEPDPIEPDYRALTFVEFVTLVRKAGQMTDEKAVEVLDTSADPSIVLLRKMLEMGGNAIHRDNVVVQDGLQTLVDKAFITGDGKDAILAAWPTV